MPSRQALELFIKHALSTKLVARTLSSGFDRGVDPARLQRFAETASLWGIFEAWLVELAYTNPAAVGKINDIIARVLVELA